MTHDHRAVDHARPAPGHSEQVELEVAALLASAPPLDASAQIALVVASDADVTVYVSDALRQVIALDVVTVRSVALALEAAARGAPRVLVVAHAERAVLRHFPGVPAVLLSDEVPPSAMTAGRRLAPLLLLRGAFRVERLLDVVASLLAEDNGATLADSDHHRRDG